MRTPNSNKNNLNSSPNDAKKKTKRQNEDRETVDSLLNLMNKNNLNFSSNRKRQQESSIKKKINTEEFNISLNTLNTKGSVKHNRIQSTEKSKEITKKENADKIIELNPIVDDSDIIQEYILYQERSK